MISSGVPLHIQDPPQAIILLHEINSFRFELSTPPVGMNLTCGNAAPNALIALSPPNTPAGKNFNVVSPNSIASIISVGVLLICKVTMDTSNLENAAKAAGLSMGISNVVIATFVTIILLIFLIKTKRKGYKGMHFTDPEPEMIEVDGILVRKDSIKEA